jgi:hypothetical protein
VIPWMQSAECRIHAARHAALPPAPAAMNDYNERLSHGANRLCERIVRRPWRISQRIGA